MINYVSVAQLNKDIFRWISALPTDIDLVVGVTRSGLLPANLLSLHRNLPLTDVRGLIESRIFDTGQRYSKYSIQELLSKKCRILVVDDSLFTGKQMNAVKNKLSTIEKTHIIQYASVYIVPGAESHVDYFYRILPMPRIFEWNIATNWNLERTCMDIDGVLCKDPLEDENDDGNEYEKFISSVKPMLLPMVTVGWLVTCRLEKYRKLTEKWLFQNGVKYNNLIMMDYPNKEATLAAGSHGSYKAAIYRKVPAKLFIESSLYQAIEIAGSTGKPVLCMETHEIIYPDAIAVAKKIVRNTPYFVSDMLKRRIRKVFALVSR